MRAACSGFDARHYARRPGGVAERAQRTIDLINKFEADGRAAKPHRGSTESAI
jgi:hypothetical protein